MRTYQVNYERRDVTTIEVEAHSPMEAKRVADAQLPEGPWSFRSCIAIREPRLPACVPSVTHKEP